MRSLPITPTSTAETKRTGRPSRGRRRRGRSRQQADRSESRPVPLHKRSSSHFQPGDRKRGADYLLEGRVRLDVDGSRARAHVEGSEQRSYGVGLDWSRVEEERVLHAFCECQRFSKGRPCKHVWATLLALAETEPDHQPQGRDRLKLRRDRAPSWRDLGIQVPESNGSQPKPVKSRPPRQRQPRGRQGGSRRRGPIGWRDQLARVREEVENLVVQPTTAEELVAQKPPAREIGFFINAPTSRQTGELVLDLFGRKPSSEDSARPKRVHLEPDELEALLSQESDVDQAEGPAVITALPASHHQPRAKGRGRRGHRRGPAGRVQRLRLPRQLFGSVLPRLCAEGALGWWDGRSVQDPVPLTWDGEESWSFVLRLEQAGGGARLRGDLIRGEEHVPLSDAVLVLPAPVDDDEDDGALIVFQRSVGWLELPRPEARPWLQLLGGSEDVEIPKNDLEEAFVSLLEIPGLPPLEAPEELRIEKVDSPAQPLLVLEPDPASVRPEPPLLAQLSFLYDSLQVSAGDARPSIVDWDEQKLVRRDTEAEHQALVRLLELGFQPVTSGQGHALVLDPMELPTVAEPLLVAGWSVEVHGTSLRRPSPPSLKVESGIDWFELTGDVDFAGDRVDFKKLLEAVRRGERFVALEDGSRGLLPSSWMATYDSLAQLAHDSSDEGLRFLPSQALFVDALLAAMPPADVDSEFAELRKRLRSFERIKPKKEPRGFEGTLRAYQRDGLGWLSFLRDYGLGGVLADDMGLGKTIQVLALIRSQRTPSKTSGLPFLVVAPRSLVFNWVDEASRFTPKLKVVQYHGSDREELHGKLEKYDMVVTTYGTLRRDIGYLAKVKFDTVILDEAQAIKNPTSQTAKASRLLHAQHRLALTGTPIENHLGELGSLFEFLNPGLLGRLPKLDVLSSGGAPSRDQLRLVADGIRPFILRRKKAEVLADLPPKTEQILLCEMKEEQRALYDRVRASYQASLMEQVEAKGVGGSAFQVLEALLRLRQIACHPALVDEEWAEAGSTKVESLFRQVDEVLDEGHKVIIFSQFTKLLSLVQKEVEARDIQFAYLDGQTRDRAEVVERFQTDEKCNLFLISLKAGGVGLNLTAADYVFLLDPWWNPAVEAQAIDRAHRIGQTQPVFAYRMIAKDTVEEKILELQKSKRQIADAILEGGEGQNLKDLSADDLRMLLS